MYVKAKYFLLETKMWDVETEWRRLGDVARDTEVILKIWRLGGHFCGAHGASASPPSLNTPWNLPIFVYTD